MLTTRAQRYRRIICLLVGGSLGVLYIHPIGHAGPKQIALSGAAPPAAVQLVQRPDAAPRAQLSQKSPAAEYTPDVRFRLRTAVAEGKLTFVGVGGEIEGLVNPTRRVKEGQVVQVDLINDDGIEHDIAFPDFNAATRDHSG